MKVYLSASSDFSLSSSELRIPLLPTRVHEILKSVKEVSVIGDRPLTKGDLLKVHSLNYVEKLFQLDPEVFMKCYEAESPLTEPFKKELLSKVLAQAGGSHYVMKRALLRQEINFYLGGGMHHALYDQGSGYCLINDVVTSLTLLAEKRPHLKTLVIDVDVHKGDGTAVLTKDNPNIFTLSFHMKEGWPLSMGDGPWQVPSSLDVEFLQNEEKEYLPRLKESLKSLQATPFDFVVVLLGADPHIEDELPGSHFIRLTDEQMLERDQTILSFIKIKKIPATFLMSGGYGKSAHRPYVNFLTSL